MLVTGQMPSEIPTSKCKDVLRPLAFASSKWSGSTAHLFRVTEPYPLVSTNGNQKSAIEKGSLEIDYDRVLWSQWSPQKTNYPTQWLVAKFPSLRVKLDSQELVVSCYGPHKFLSNLTLRSKEKFAETSTNLGYKTWAHMKRT